MLKRALNRSFLRTWVPIILGAILGVSLSWFHTYDLDCLNEAEYNQHFPDINSDYYGDDITFDKQSKDNNEDSIEGDPDDDFEPRIITDPALKPKVDPEANKKVIRPRYISTELGIREKLFTGVITSRASINSLGVAVNKTLSSHLQKLVFYSDYIPASRDGPTETKLPEAMTIVSHSNGVKPVDILYKSLIHMFDNYQDIYDWFYIMYDYTYTQPERIMNVVNHMSITRLLYMGVPLETAVQTSFSIVESENKKPEDSNDQKFQRNYYDATINGKYCDGRAGMIISRALLIELVPRMNDCINTISSTDADVWLGQCIISLTAGKISCIQHEEEQIYQSVNIGKIVDINTESSREFLKAVTAFPIKDEKTMYTLHKKYCEIEIDETYKKIEQIQEEIKKLAPKAKTQEGEVALTWPIGVNPPFQPTQRWDIITWDFFTEEYSLACPGEIPKCDLTPTEKEDIKNVLETTMKWVNEKYNKEGLYLAKKKLENGYRRFDPQRGMDYILDIILVASSVPFPSDFDPNSNTPSKLKTIELSHRLQVLKPLSHVEIVPMPYVTETSRVNILLPVQDHNKHLFKGYLEFFDQNILVTKEKAQLTVIFVYSSEAAKQLELRVDIYAEQKIMLDELEKKYPSVDKTDNKKRIPWMSVKTDNYNSIKIVDVISKTKRFPPESLFFLSSVAVRITGEYLNRCRMNTISNWQVFFPIPFSAFNPDLIYDASKNETPPKNIEIKANSGHFDIYSYDDICFYHSDYSKARNLMKSDNEDDIYGMFVEKSDLHVFRAVEAALKRVWLLRDCKTADGFDKTFSSFRNPSIPASVKYCERSNAEGLAPRAVLGTKIYPEPQS